MAAENGKKTFSQHWSSLKAEFAKIIWPENQTVVRQSAATIIISAILGVLIAVLDMLIQYGVDFLVNL